MEDCPFLTPEPANLIKLQNQTIIMPGYKRHFIAVFIVLKGCAERPKLN